jgi:hypothetical protein
MFNSRFRGARAASLFVSAACRDRVTSMRLQNYVRKDVAGRVAGNYTLAGCAPRKYETCALPSLKCPQILGHVWIFRRQRFHIADFDVDFFYTRPFCARAKKPPPLSNDTCGVKSVTRDQKLHALAGAEIWTDYGAFVCAVFVQHKNFNRIAQVTVVKLIVANAMESHRCVWRDHKTEGGTRWPTIKKWCRQAAGRNSLVANKCDANEAARGMRLKLQKSSNLFRCEIIDHVFFLNM